MGAPAAQFQFAAEIVAFLVCLAGVGLLAMRASLLSLRRGPVLALAAGFVTTGAGAFVHGAIQAGPVGPPSVVGLRLAGGLLLLAGASPRRGWSGGRLPRALMLPAGVTLAAAGPVALTGSVYPAEAVLVAGAAIAGTALGLASRRAIGARLTATAAGTLLVIVVTLSVALSTVLSGTVRDDALRRLQARAATVAATVSDSWRQDLADAKLVAASVEGLGLAGPGPDAPLQSAINQLSSEFFSDVYVMWLGAQGEQRAVTPGLLSTLGPDVAGALARSNLVGRSLITATAAGTAGVAGGKAVDVAVYPARAPGVSGVSGVAVVVSPLGGSYLADQVRDDRTLGVALVAGGRVVSRFPSSAGTQAAPALGAATAALAGRSTVPTTVGGQFVAASAVEGGNGQRVMAVLVETPASVVDSTRQSLFRTLFLIAFGGSIIAFLLAVAVADRLSRALGALTGAARRISTGETVVRTGISSDDEIGVLAEAFDSMAGSIEEQRSALRLAAEEDRQLRGRLQSVIAGMGEALVGVDADGTVSEWNRAAEQLLGVRRSRAVGRPVASVVSVRMDDGRDLAAILAGGPSGAASSGRGTVHGPDGSVPVAVSVGVVGAGPEEGAAAGTVGVLRDLRSEQELERMKSEFLSRVGHELRTPLTGILGYTQLLASRDVPPERAQSWHQEILQQSRRLLRTVEMLEFFASAGANRLGLDVAPERPRAVVDDALDRWKNKIPDTHRLVGRAARRLPEVAADRRWVDLALDELIDNAVKFSPDGGRVVVEAGTADGTAVGFSVVDQGTGMTPEQTQAAFGEFVQGDPSDTRRFGGLGLGLPLVQRVAEAHGGRVEWESEPGRGSRLCLVLPSVDPDHPQRRGLRSYSRAMSARDQDGRSRRR